MDEEKQEQATEQVTEQSAEQGAGKKEWKVKYQWARKPYYIDNPEAREKAWRENPKAVDQYGNKLIKIGYYWCSYDFNRLWELAQEKDDATPFILIGRVADGRIFSRDKSAIRHARASWKRKIESKWYVFIDPITQQVYQ